MTTNIHIFSLSASEHSVSRSCYNLVQFSLMNKGVNVFFRDIRNLPPIWVNGVIPNEYSSIYSEIADELSRCDGFILLLPIHCYSMASTCKVITEVFFTPLRRKPISFITSAGGRNSFLAVRDIMTSLIFDSEAFIFPKHVFLTKNDLDKNYEPNDELQQRLTSFSNDFLSFVEATKMLAK
jgi:NAD(P)H-dependent FMN reductase